MANESDIVQLLKETDTDSKVYPKVKPNCMEGKIASLDDVNKVSDDISGLQSQISEEKVDRINAVSDLDSRIDNKQDSLNATQLSAINSGIDSDKVTQIATNTSDIAKKQDKLTAGSGINISNDNIISSDVFDLDISIKKKTLFIDGVNTHNYPNYKVVLAGNVHTSGGIALLGIESDYQTAVSQVSVTQLSYKHENSSNSGSYVPMIEIGFDVNAPANQGVYAYYMEIGKTSARTKSNSLAINLGFNSVSGVTQSGQASGTYKKVYTLGNSYAPSFAISYLPFFEGIRYCTFALTAVGNSLVGGYFATSSAQTLETSSSIYITNDDGFRIYVPNITATETDGNDNIPDTITYCTITLSNIVYL